jgi:hypothetical protein
MTCEVAVMNKRGAALAADSAVTVGDGAKIYHHARKLFALAPATPVGIMISGVPEIMGVPWEIIIKSYARQLGDQRFDRLEEYARDFLRFVESSTALFPDAVQRDWFGALVENYWRDQLAAPLGLGNKRKAPEPPRDPRPTLAHLLRRDHATWRKYPDRSPETLHFTGGLGDKVLADYGLVLDRLERRVFGARARSREVRQALRTTVKFMYDKPWFHPHDRSWIAFIGFGEAELFPVLEEYLVGSVASGRLRWIRTGEATVSREDPAHVVPLAQRDAIDMFFRGVDPALDAKLENMLMHSVSRGLAGERGHRHSQVGKIRKEFRRLLENEIDGKYETPLMAAINAMPQYGLAEIAEAMVRLTAFRQRIAVGQKETVDRSVDVVIVSKGEGFAWVKQQGATDRRVTTL